MSSESTVASPPSVHDVHNVIDGAERPAASGRALDKFAPATGDLLSRVARSGAEDVDDAIRAAQAAQPAWARTPAVERGRILREIAKLLEARADEMATVVADETGKPHGDALGETGGAIEMGYFVAGEGRRFYGKVTTSAVPHRQASIIRQPLGVAGLIIAANTPIANVAWKVFPALMCGNAAVLKASEDTPETANAFARIAREAGLPDGLLNVVHGLGEEAGQPLVEDPRVALVSFTGSTAVGRMIARVAGERLAKVCLELGGKNPLVVCDDADLGGASKAAADSAYSNAGQRCAAGSRLIVFEGVYDEFKRALLERTDGYEPGPVINERQLEFMLAKVGEAVDAGATLLAGGRRAQRPGFFLEPTLLEGTDALTGTELFGPITVLHRVPDFDRALELANASPYGLTAAIWTASVHRGQEFVARIQSGVAAVNGPTFGSEPHWPFGGLRDSGTGWREAGTGGLDVYSDLKTVHVTHDPQLV